MHTGACTTDESRCCESPVFIRLGVAREGRGVADSVADGSCTNLDLRDDDDYDIDFYTVGPVAPEHLETQATQPSPREQLEVCGLRAIE